MSVRITVPRDLQNRPLADRCRWWANAYMQLPQPNLHVVELLREAAVEVEMQGAYYDQALARASSPREGRPRSVGRWFEGHIEPSHVEPGHGHVIGHGRVRPVGWRDHLHAIRIRVLRHFQ